MKKSVSLSMLFLLCACSKQPSDFYVNNLRDAFVLKSNNEPTYVETFVPEKLSNKPNPFKPRLESPSASSSKQYFAAAENLQDEIEDGVELAASNTPISNLSTQKERFDYALAKVAKGDKSGVPELQKLADQGHASAQYNMAILHLQGNMVSKSSAKATKYLTLAANNYHPEASLALGNMYLRGDSGLSKSSKMAEKYLTRAASQNNDQAKIFLSMMYANGDGVQKDLVKAYKMLASVRNPGGQAGENINRNLAALKQGMSANELSQIG